MAGMNDKPEADPRPDSTPSLWEMMGRGVGKGLRAAKNLGETVGQEVGKISTRKEAEEELDSRYRILGRMVSEQILQWKRESVSADDPSIRSLLEEIRELGERLDDAEPPSPGDDGSPSAPP